MRSRGWVPRSDPDLYGAGEPVVQSAPVAVPDEGRYGQAQQRAAQQGPPEPEPAAALGDDPQTEDTLAGGGADRPDGEDVQDEEHAERVIGGALRVACEEAVRDEHAQRPVEEQRAEAPPEGGG